ncbi:820_t:CDS:1 [Dentiscutata erythropus]|uniref:820_t:CDS:1 n=1 Tax=Dentiscutata erythropus TaxID=1348616 RepID=A0A9N9G1F8_9GLOM|nr:820_t:CDS:1 [Dentiscutata erythropus]
MNQSSNQNVGVQPQNNNGLRILQNIGSPQNAAGLLRRAQNIVRQPLRPQNAANVFVSNLTAVQQYIDLVEGIDLYARSQKTQYVENGSLQIFNPTSGNSFP